jgi:ribosome-associated protein
MMQSERLRDLALEALSSMKAVDVTVIDVRGHSAITDFMIVASGTSDRHLKSVATSVVVRAKESGVMPLGVEGEQGGEWVLVDLRDVVVHVMLPRVRAFYQLEKLWGADMPIGVMAGAAR